MNPKTIKLLDGRGTIVATAQISKQRDHFTGTIDLRVMPLALCQTFQEYEALVNGQMFGLLDEIEDQISAIPFTVTFDDDTSVAIIDLQIYPRTGRISFRIINETALDATRV